MPKKDNEKKLYRGNSELSDLGANWSELANHLQAKVNKRTSEVAFLHTRAGFLMASAVVLLQIITDMPKFTDCWLILYFAAMFFALLSMIASALSMYVDNAPAPLNPDEMILNLAERPNMKNADFARWLAKSYAEANHQFNKVYNCKYKQQVIATLFLIMAFVAIIILKGVKLYG